MNLYDTKQQLHALKLKNQTKLDAVVSKRFHHLTHWKKKHIYLERLEKIEQALESIEDGSYGLCQKCQKPISTKRLDSIPYVATCYECELGL